MTVSWKPPVLHVPDSATLPPEGRRRNWRRVLRWWKAPFWFAALFSGAKSFADNPILGSRRLNRAGLHVWRLRTAHALANLRRARLATHVRADLREQFDRDGFVVIRDVLPSEAFQQLQKDILDARVDCRVHQQGDTITRRVPLGPALRARFPQLAALIDSGSWRALLAYVASTRSQPFYYIQTIAGGVADGPPDPQIQLHSDTFHPSLKAWLFLTDVPDDGRPLTYIAGSHRLTPKRMDWEYRKSIEVLKTGDRLSQRGSFRVSADELAVLGLPQPTRFCVPANTLVVIDTCGFHARGDADHSTLRVELWAYCRRNPFVPWVRRDFLSLGLLTHRRAQLLSGLIDWLERCGLMQQHWRRAGRKRVGSN